MKKKKDEITIRSSAAEYLTYVASVGDQQDSIEMRYEDENIWLTQKMMATLYDVGTNTINYHIKKIFEDGELQEDSVIRKFRITALDGKGYNTNHYSLEMIIAVGFKINSERAVQFRKWVNQIAKDYTIKGWVMDDERLKRGTYLTEKYFDEQLERIREIRASERKFYQKITDLYATAIDYDKNSATTRRFYATVQNKMHYAVHGHTAAELIVERANHTKENMGLTTWADAPEGKIKKSDVTVYRVEKYLDRCVESIVNQTFGDFELILVDDGSPDNCPAMCDAWAQKDDRIRVIHKKNGGLSSARNAGMAKMTGKYVCFIDSDDWVETNTFEVLLELLKKYPQVQIAACNAQIERGTTSGDM